MREFFPPAILVVDVAVNSLVEIWLLDLVLEEVPLGEDWEFVVLELLFRGIDRRVVVLL